MNSIKTTILYLLLACSLIVILISFIILPTVTNIKENKKTLTSKQTEFIDNEDKVAILKNFQKNPDNFQDRLDKINGLWPTESEVSNFIINLENIASAENITLKNISMTEPKSVAAKKKDSNSKKKMAVGFSFDTQTSFAQNLAIIKNMESLSRFNSIKQINLTEQDGGTVLMKIIGSIYYGE